MTLCSYKSIRILCKKKSSAFSVKDICELIKPSSNRKVMEYVQPNKFSSCQVLTTEEEQFISLNIPENLPRLWQQYGYTHLHFGVVRIGLTLYARKELPFIARNRLNRLLIKVISTSLHRNGSNDIKCRNGIHNIVSKL